MKTLEIQVKFQKEDEIYTTKQVREQISCDICEGTGRIDYNGKMMKCPECNGVGVFTTNRQIHVVCDEPFVISSTDIKISSNGQTIVKYRGYCGFNKYNRQENSLFNTKEEAQQRCNDLNRERKFVRLDDIIIKDSFKLTKPSIEKIQEKLEHYRVNNKFEKEIILDENNTLIDGYITYLLCKALGNEITKVIIKEQSN